MCSQKQLPTKTSSNAFILITKILSTGKPHWSTLLSLTNWASWHSSTQTSRLTVSAIKSKPISWVKNPNPDLPGDSQAQDVKKTTARGTTNLSKQGGKALPQDLVRGKCFRRERESSTDYSTSILGDDALCMLTPETFSAGPSSASGYTTMIYIQRDWRPHLVILFPEFTEMYNTKNKRIR